MRRGHQSPTILVEVLSTGHDEQAFCYRLWFASLFFECSISIEDIPLGGLTKGSFRIAKVESVWKWSPTTSKFRAGPNSQAGPPTGGNLVQFNVRPLMATSALMGLITTKSKRPWQDANEHGVLRSKG